MNRWWILSLVIKCDSWIDQHDTSMGQRKKLESLTRIQPTSWTLGGCFNLLIVVKLTPMGGSGEWKLVQSYFEDHILIEWY